MAAPASTRRSTSARKPQRNLRVVKGANRDSTTAPFTLHHGDVRDVYSEWETPNTIITAQRVKQGLESNDLRELLEQWAARLPPSETWKQDE